jgi:hypothetical protein
MTPPPSADLLTVSAGNTSIIHTHMCAFLSAGCSKPYYRPPQLDVDYGTPVGLCREDTPGVFSREYTHAHVSMDCATYTPTIIHQ